MDKVQNVFFQLFRAPYLFLKDLLSIQIVGLVSFIYLISLGIAIQFKTQEVFVLALIKLIIEAGVSIILLIRMLKKRTTPVQNLPLDTFVLIALISYSVYDFIFLPNLSFINPNDGQILPLLTRILYIITNSSFCLYLYLSIDKKTRQSFLVQPLTWVAMGFIVCLSQAFLASLMGNWYEIPVSLRILNVIIEISECILFTLAFLFFLCSFDPFWVWFSAGLLIISAGNFSWYLDHQVGTVIAPIAFQSFWMFGILLICLTALISKRKPYRLHPFDSRSISLTVKLLMLIVVTSFIFMGYIIFNHDVHFVDNLTASIYFGVITSGLTGQFVYHKLEHFSRSLIKLFKEELLSATTSQDLLQVSNLPSELDTVYRNSVESRIRELEEKQKETLQKAIDISRARFLAKIAHNIKSPLAALKMLGNENIIFNEEEKILLKIAVSRISDMAHEMSNDYIQVSRKYGVSDFKSEQLSSCPVVESIETTIALKRTEYRQLNNLTFVFNNFLENKGYSSFVDCIPSEFEQILSNLVNNSIEALNVENYQEILIQLTSESSWVVVEIIDQGRGIPDFVKRKLGKHEFTYGKQSGIGIGLSHAFQTIEDWGGKIEIQDSYPQGTRVKISLRKAPVPSWFLSQLTLREGMHIVIIDDDRSIHELWGKKFFKILPMTIHNLYSPEHIESLLNRICVPLTDVIFLFDYEYLHRPENGLDWIEKLDLQRCSYLVTSWWENQSIQDRCRKLGIKMIPKFWIETVPILKIPINY